MIEKVLRWVLILSMIEMQRKASFYIRFFQSEFLIKRLLRTGKAHYIQ